MKPVPIKLSSSEKRYALALSKRLPNCPRPKEGSIAHALKYLLHERAKAENVPLSGSVYFV
jgi:hypothetical protein